MTGKEFTDRAWGHT